jgi:uncharacterized protein DUF4367
MKDMDFETQLRSIASGMDYPPTPDIAGAMAARLRAPRPRLINRSFARSLVIVLVLLASLLLIPPVRAAVLDFIQIGIVRIFRSEPASAPLPTQIPFTIVPVTGTAAATQTALTPLTATPSSLISMLEQMAGETTLTGAQQMTTYPILLPAYPAGIGEPDRVFVQDAEGFMTILVWTDPQHPEKMKMSLHFIPEGSWAVDKFSPVAVEETSVNGQPAVWAVGPYPVRLRNGELEFQRMVNGHVLIWEDGGVTYRLETDMSMDEAVKTAESLQPIP